MYTDHMLISPGCHTAAAILAVLAGDLSINGLLASRFELSPALHELMQQAA